MSRALQRLESPVSDSLEDERLLAELRTAAYSLAERFIGVVAFDLVQRVCLEEFVSCAHQRQLATQGERATQAQIGWLTGIGPEAVRSVLNSSVGSSRPPQPLGVAERVLWLWRTDPDFLEEDGATPARLFLLGGRGTFQGLVGRVVRGITPQIALNALMARGAVELVDAHWVRLLRVGGAAQGQQPEGERDLGRAAASADAARQSAAPAHRLAGARRSASAPEIL